MSSSISALFLQILQNLEMGGHKFRFQRNKKIPEIKNIYTGTQETHCYSINKLNSSTWFFFRLVGNANYSLNSNIKVLSLHTISQKCWVVQVQIKQVMCFFLISKLVNKNVVREWVVSQTWIWSKFKNNRWSLSTVSSVLCHDQ